jgi:hypothetical protein
MLLQLGQFGAAQPLLQPAVQNAGSPQLGALANDVLSQVFMEDQQWDKAIECFGTVQVLCFLH